jgi:hypothetical protein
VTPRKPQRPPWDEVCARFRSALRRLIIQLGVARLVVFALVALAALIVLDWRLDLSTPVRLLVLVGFVAALAAGFVLEIRRHLRRVWNDPDVLHYLDSLHPEGEDALLVLHELHHGEGVEETRSTTGRALLEQALTDLDPALAEAQAGLMHSVRRRRVRGWQTAAGGVVLAAGLAALLFGPHVRTGLLRFFNPFSAERWPHRTYITVQDAPRDRHWFVAQGREFRVRASVSGVEIPAEVVLYSRPRAGGDWVPERLSTRLAPDGRHYTVEHLFPQVNQPISFYLAGGDDKTPSYIVDVNPAPELVKTQAVYHYPPYAGKRDLIDERARDLRGLEGTRVDLTFTASVDLAQATFQLDNDTPQVCRLDSPRTFRVSDLVLRKNGSYRVRLVDVKGLTELRPEGGEIVVQPDEPPTADILLPQEDLVATPRAALKVSLRAVDDFGLAAVRFLVAVGADTAAVLHRNITGDIVQTGTVSTQTFDWDLSKSKFPVPTRLTYFLFAQDINPTGKGVAESRRYQIDIVRPSQFHLELFERAKAVLAEARLAAQNQKRAHDLAGTWPEKGSGEPEDRTWTELNEAQRLSARAAERMKDLLLDLNREIERNRMPREVASGRLNRIGELLEQVLSTYHPPVLAALRGAVPRTDSEAAPDRLKATRAAALAKCADDQKLAGLYLYRILRKLYDWRDLQNAYIQTTLLSERQDDVTDRTEKIAPEYIGKEAEDLTDAQIDRLLTLGKQQKAIYETEGTLEEELKTIIDNATKRRRVWILTPIMDAFTRLRERQVNENMKDAWLKIENNQPFMITKTQKDVKVVLAEVRTGLEIAGNFNESDPPILLAQVLGEEDPEVAVAAAGEVPVTTTGEATTPIDVAALLGGLKKEWNALPPGEALDLAIQAAIGLQEGVHARTKYLSGNNSAGEMPRFIRLKLAMLEERQAGAVGGADKALGLARDVKMQEPALRLQDARAEMTWVQTLLKAGDVGAANQQIQKDLVDSMRDLIGFLSRQHEIAQRADEHAKAGGLDAFKRKYIVREKDLDLAVDVARRSDYAHLLQNDVLRKVQRLRSQSDTEPALVKQIETGARAAAADRQRAVVGLAAAVETAAAGFTPDVAERLKTGTAVAELSRKVSPDAVGRIQAATFDQPFAEQLSQSSEALYDVVRRLNFLLDEREEVQIVAAPLATQRATTGPAVRPLTEAEILALITPEALSKAVRESQELPEPLRERMLESLKLGLNPKYQRALGAYYRAIAGPTTRPAAAP